ncbi:hypothetical protein NLJ89_g11945 [Agrocybe chaxingu]|uniref:Reverse transcriptase Ty1/copia-type domain-containing protein n=1 Tax=Agrocybe chaxingu TaxID=84603 RepID=A0A9W8JP54_9AGAR|nr:hypothetical protein NLJ89_g11945 [Agrocybe chaxingu]
MWGHCLAALSSCPPSDHDLSDVRDLRARKFDLSKPPRSYTEAMARPDRDVWVAAMKREATSLEGMKAFWACALPDGKRLIDVKWVFDFKYDEDGKRIPGMEKARLVARGFTQRPDDFGETYAPVAKIASIRIILAWAARRDAHIFQFDVSTAFLHARNRHPVYCRQIPGHPIGEPGQVLEVLVALYGLCQSAYEWYCLLMSIFLSIGLIHCEADHGIFYAYWSSPPDPTISMPPDGSPLFLIVPVHVDDGLGVTNSEHLYRWFIARLQTRIRIKDLGVCSRFLSVSIIRDRTIRRLWFSSHLYIADLLDDWGMSACKPSSTPLPANSYDASSRLGVKVVTAQPLALPTQRSATVKHDFQCLVGCLLYLAVTSRPDIAFAAMWLGQFSSEPTRDHLAMAKHCLRYLAGTRNLALSFGAPSSSVPEALRGFLQNVGCSDADWASNDDCKSISGYCFYFEGSLVSWSAVKQKSITLSSTEAEYYAMAHAFREAIWLRLLLTTLNFPVPKPFPILSDNQAALKLALSSSISSRSKHIDIRHHFLRSHITDGTFTTSWIPTADMPADIFTKSLPFPAFSRHRDVLGLMVPPDI